MPILVLADLHRDHRPQRGQRHPEEAHYRLGAVDPCRIERVARHVPQAA